MIPILARARNNVEEGTCRAVQIRACSFLRYCSYKRIYYGQPKEESILEKILISNVAMVLAEGRPNLTFGDMYVLNCSIAISVLIANLKIIDPQIPMNMKSTRRLLAPLRRARVGDIGYIIPPPGPLQWRTIALADVYQSRQCIAQAMSTRRRSFKQKSPYPHPRRMFASSGGHGKEHATEAENGVNRTGLHELHVERGGKMVPFANYAMPVQYSDLSVGDSHRWTREKCSLFDVGHM